MTNEQFNEFSSRLLKEDITPAQVALVVADMQEVQKADVIAYDKLQKDCDNWKQQATDYALANSKLFAQQGVAQGNDDNTDISNGNTASQSITCADLQIDFN